MKRLTNDTYLLSTGNKIYAHGNTIGLNTKTLEMSTGWDGGLDTIYTKGIRYQELSKKEKLEIAEYMVQSWKKYIKQLED